MTNTPTLGPGAPIDVDRLIESRMLVQASSGGGKSWVLRRPLSRRTDPATSEAAAASIASALPQLEQDVLDALVRRGEQGATTHELADLIGAQLVSVSPRIAPLRERGLVRDSGSRRKGDSGRFSTVWRIA